MTYVDAPDKKQKHPHYEHRTEKLDRKDNEFSSKKFHHIRKVSTHKKLLKSFGRIGMCLNDKPTTSLPIGDLDKVCFILVNDYEEDDDNELGVGPLNDGYLLGLKHHRYGFKVFYLYNPRAEEFSQFLGFFLKHTQHALTIFYTGHSNNGISFNDSLLSQSTISEIIEDNSNGEAHVVFITDCPESGSVFDIKSTGQKNPQTTSNLISFYVEKTNGSTPKESKRSHGIFTYYFCKITSDCPNITPNRLVERMSPSLKRFGETFKCDITDHKLADSPIYFN
ncbi:hypothetical protein M9Y10_000392 [Tritrichomonas musculus]|uniref:Peptidase C14 caspase domain-containing protein n=1 Tax=Tritrichomonas musculus TaxID=1915356 RepID=A0ABR2L4J5_9EUKA